MLPLIKKIMKNMKNMKNKALRGIELLILFSINFILIN